MEHPARHLVYIVPQCSVTDVLETGWWIVFASEKRHPDAARLGCCKVIENMSQQTVISFASVHGPCAPLDAPLVKALRQTFQCVPLSFGRLRYLDRELCSSVVSGCER